MKYIFRITAFVVIALAAENTFAQTLTKEQAALERTKTDSLTKVNYQQTLQSLGIKLPVLPPQADDPARPKNSVPRANGSGYTDAKGMSLTRSPWGAWVNYDEDKANDYTLPDPLVLKNGKPVNNAQIWWKQRRPEIISDYETSVFGRVPKNTPKVKFEVTDVDKTTDGSTIKKTIVGHIDNSGYPATQPVIKMTLFLPANALGPVPLMVIASSNSSGNAQTIKLLNNTGWAIAYFDTNALQTDNGAGLSNGIIGLVNKGKLRGPEDWGVLRAWSWGMSRALDYFETDKTINPKQIGIEGHSRWGKTALLAGAMDQRWAIVFASCSGSGGASLEKRNFGENLDLIAAENEYHWMAPNFIKYGGNWKAFPVDAHDMMALVAPRPLFVTGGTQDIWADPVGEFKACVAATPVYTLLGKTGITAGEFPAPDVSLINGELAFRNHEGGHTDSMDWPVFIDFAKKYFK
nr:acetylxylan esterase [Pedobacter panaciterrae]